MNKTLPETLQEVSEIVGLILVYIFCGVVILFAVVMHLLN